MTDTISTPATVTAANPAPDVAQPVTGPVTPTPTTSTTVSPVTTTVAAPVTIAPTEPVQSVLSEALTKTPETPAPAPAAPVEAPQPTPEATTPEATQTPDAQTDAPAPAPVYEPFTLPEGVQLQEDRVKEFTGLLSDLELTGKVPHEFAQQFGQKAVDFHIQELNRFATDLQTYYQTAFDKQKTDWKDEFIKDPEIGGNKMQTTVDNALKFIRMYGGTPEQQTELRQVMDSYGVGNHKALIRTFANAGLALAQEGSPLAAPKPAATQIKSKTETLYGKNK